TRLRRFLNVNVAGRLFVGEIDGEPGVTRSEAHVAFGGLRARTDFAVEEPAHHHEPKRDDGEGDYPSGPQHAAEFPSQPRLRRLLSRGASPGCAATFLILLAAAAWAR